MKLVRSMINGNAEQQFVFVRAEVRLKSQLTSFVRKRHSSERGDIFTRKHPDHDERIRVSIPPPPSLLASYKATYRDLN